MHSIPELLSKFSHSQVSSKRDGFATQLALIAATHDYAGQIVCMLLHESKEFHEYVVPMLRASVVCSNGEY
jgi:hypothetical protein